MPHYLDFHNFAVNFETERVSPPPATIFQDFCGHSVSSYFNFFKTTFWFCGFFLLFLSFLFHSVLFWLFTASSGLLFEFVCDFYNWKMDICLTPLGLSFFLTLDSEDRSDSRSALAAPHIFIIYCCHCFLVIKYILISFKVFLMFSEGLSCY